MPDSVAAPAENDPRKRRGKTSTLPTCHDHGDVHGFQACGPDPRDINNPRVRPGW